MIGRFKSVGNKTIFLSFGVSDITLVPHESATKASHLKNTPQARQSVIKWIIGTAKGMIDSLFSRDKGGAGSSHIEM